MYAFLHARTDICDACHLYATQTMIDIEKSRNGDSFLKGHGIHQSNIEITRQSSVGHQFEVAYCYRHEISALHLLSHERKRGELHYGRQ